MATTKIILQPVSHPEMDAIHIESELFPLGRTEPPFDSMPSEIATKLSRRHAKIFQEQDKSYITDLDSGNGTRLNERDLAGGQAEVLNEGDLIELAGEFSFRVELDRATDLSETRGNQPSVQLMLQPENERSDLEPIVVTQFPFLIARKDSIFERYNEELPKLVGQISRRHAVITRRNGEFYLEDLGSKNGTSVNGSLLDEHARKLADGDTLAIGGDHFVYKIRLLTDDETEIITGTLLSETSLNDTETTDAGQPTGTDFTDSGETSSTSSGEAPSASSGEASFTSSGEASSTSPMADRTMFVDSPTSFLQIFCGDGEESGEAADKADEQEIETGEKRDRPERPAGKLRSAGALAGEIGRAFKGDTKLNPKLVKPGVAVLLLVLAVFAGINLFSADKNKIKKLMTDGQYLESAELANGYLSSHPEETEIEDWGRESLIRAFVPPWIEHMQQGEFTQATELIQQLRTRFTHLKQSQQHLNLLEWAGRLQAHVQQRGGANGPIRIFQDDLEMRMLHTDWDRESARNQQVFGQIANLVPQFEELQKRIFSDLRQLRHDNSLYGAAITELTAAIEAGIQKGNVEEISNQLREFEINYPRLSGLDKLEQDAQSYREMLQLLDQADLATLVRLRQRPAFNTSLFEELAGPLLEQQLPGEKVVAEYDKAMAAWQLGDKEKATAALQPLTIGSWREFVERQITHFEDISAEYETLQAASGRSGYVGQLLAFRAKLDKQQDSYFLQAISSDFESHKEQLTGDLAASYDLAKSQWDAFQNAGGINGVARIEESISDHFRAQAERLSAAYKEATKAIHTYRLLQTAPPKEWDDLAKHVVTEVKRQRRWIQDLKVVLDPKLLQAKLALIPVIQEDKQ